MNNFIKKKKRMDGWTNIRDKWLIRGDNIRPLLCET